MMRPGMEYNNNKGMMAGPMVSRSNSVTGSRSMLQQQLMDMGTSAVQQLVGWQKSHMNPCNLLLILALEALFCLSGVLEYELNMYCLWGSGGSGDMGMGMSPFSQQGQPSQSSSWPDTILGMEGNRCVTPTLSFVSTPNKLQ